MAPTHPTFFHVNSHSFFSPLYMSSFLLAGMIAPKTAEGWWRANMKSSDVPKYPFYKCLPDRCSGSANNSNASCALNFNGPKCNTCAPNYLMTNGMCEPCPSRDETSSVTGSLIGLVVCCMLVYIVGGSCYLAQPALSVETTGKINLALNRSESFKVGLDADNNLNRQSFSKIMAAQDSELHLTPREAALVFDTVDADKSGKISLEELNTYAKNNQPTRDVLQENVDTFQTVRENSGIDSREDVAEQMNTMEEHSKNLNIQKFRVPSIRLKDFPNISLPMDVGDFELPSFELIGYPNIKFENITWPTLGDIELPSIQLLNFPNLSIPDSMIRIVLPSILLIDYPGIKIPTFNLTNLTFRAPQLKMDIGKI